MRYNWRKPATWPLTRKVVVLMIAATYLPLAYVGYAWGPGATAQQGPTQVYVYELPQEVRSARSACYDAARDTYDVPEGRNAYLSWWRDNEGSATQRAWTAAFEDCKVTNPMPGGKWNFAGMTLVRIEERR